MIDKNKIKPKDYISGTYSNGGMVDAGIEPELVAGTVYRDGGQLWVGPIYLHNPGLIVTKCTPAAPQWNGALVVEDREGDVCGLRGEVYVVLSEDDDTEYSPTELENAYGPCKVVLDKNGNFPMYS